MKDLLVLTADADAKAVMQVVLSRPQSLGIRSITYEVVRHRAKDPGVISEGPELVRTEKGSYQQVILLCDYQGCGLDCRKPPLSSEEGENQLQRRLDANTWTGNSGAILIVPELDEWLWHNPSSISQHLMIETPTLETWVLDYATKCAKGADDVRHQSPKELLEFVFARTKRQTVAPRDFEAIARAASLRDWQQSPSFSRLLALLRAWFSIA